MIDVYAFATPNSVKVPIALEELGLPYALRAVNIRKGEQSAPAFVALNPNARVPVMVDHEAAGGPLVLSESAAILIYLAEKAGKLLPASGAARARVFEQLFFHASGLSPAFGNTGYFTKHAPQIVPFAVDRFRNEGARILGVLDRTLAGRAFISGDELSIADIAHFGWLWRRDFAGFDFEKTPNLARWFASLEARPAFKRGVEKTSALAEPKP